VENREEPMSLHQVDFVQMVQMAERLGYRIGPAVLYGVEPGEIGWSMEFSQGVAAEMPKLPALVIAEIESMLEASP
jgi:Ni,Fe-hydrogenase maturation factor